jgi:hypothetical protein
MRARSRSVAAPGILRRRPFSEISEEIRFAMDSPLEGGVSCELVSENAKFPASRDFTGNFIDSRLRGA